MDLKREELAWAAGFFDGEGTAHFSRGTRKTKIGGRTTYSSIHLSVTQTNLEELERFKAAVGVGYICGPYQNKNPNSKPHWRYFAGAFQHYQHVMTVLWPFLCSRKRAQLKDKHQQFISFVRLPLGRPRKPQDVVASNLTPLVVV